MREMSDSFCNFMQRGYTANTDLFWDLEEDDNI